MSPLPQKCLRATSEDGVRQSSSQQQRPSREQRDETYNKNILNDLQITKQKMYTLKNYKPRRFLLHFALTSRENVKQCGKI
jgi:hypothetical protein